MSSRHANPVHWAFKSKEIKASLPHPDLRRVAPYLDFADLEAKLGFPKITLSPMPA